MRRHPLSNKLFDFCLSDVSFWDNKCFRKFSSLLVRDSNHSNIQNIWMCVKKCFQFCWRNLGTIKINWFIFQQGKVNRCFSQQIIFFTFKTNVAENKMWAAFWFRDIVQMHCLLCWGVVESWDTNKVT